MENFNFYIMKKVKKINELSKSMKKLEKDQLGKLKGG